MATIAIAVKSCHVPEIAIAISFAEFQPDWPPLTAKYPMHSGLQAFSENYVMPLAKFEEFPCSILHSSF